MAKGAAKQPVWPWRRACQLMLLLLVAGIAWLSQNPETSVPSRIVQGQVPDPVLVPASGDTWALELFGVRFLHPVAFVENWLAAKVLYLPGLSAVLLPLGATLVLGRIFCSWMCPVGLLLEWNMRLGRALERSGIRRHLTIPDLRYLLLAVCLVFALVFAMPLLAVLDPPHVLGRELIQGFTHHRVTALGVAILAGVLLADWLVAERAWCRWFCPSGGGLSLLSRFRLLRIDLDAARCSRCGDCNRACPYHLEPMHLADEKGFDWVTCDNCGRCRDSCPEGAIGYRFDRCLWKRFGHD